MKYAIIVLLASLLIGQTNPCNDSTFVALKKNPINDMEQREYDYFMMMSKECAEYQRESVATTAQDTVAQTIQLSEDYWIERQERIDNLRMKIFYGYIGFAFLVFLAMAITIPV